MTPPDELDLLTTHQAAELLDVTRRTLARWRWKETGPAFIRLGESRQAHVRYRRADLETWLEGRRQQKLNV